VKLDCFDYDLPEHFIAQTPVTPRDKSRLLVYDRAADRTELKHFCDIVDYLKPGDVIVINTTRVMPARLNGLRLREGALSINMEILLTSKLDKFQYEIICKPMRRLKVGDSVAIGGYAKGFVQSIDTQKGTAIMHFNRDPQDYGDMPLPHYIHEKLNDTERYQTVYSKTVGSCAAPTAGLHWTPELMERARKKGVIFCEILLHVGVGTFRPVKVDDIHDHKMHAEYYQVTADAARIINAAKRDGRRVICVGTTSMRTLEAVHAKHGAIVEDTGETDIFIYPGFHFNAADALVTNFHLPKSTLIMLVSAFVGREKVLELYETAKQNGFRFFSFGDACLFL